MKNVKMLKKLFILVMSIGLVLTFSNLVYAEDEDPFFAITATEQESNEQQATNTDTSGSLFTDTDNTNTANTANTTNTTNTENTNNASNSLLPTNNISNNTNNSAVNSAVNRNVTNTDTLAKTGLSDSKGIITLIVVLCGVSAIYSYKKINDYKKL